MVDFYPRMVVVAAVVAVMAVMVVPGEGHLVLAVQVAMVLPLAVAEAVMALLVVKVECMAEEEVADQVPVVPEEHMEERAETAEAMELREQIP